MGSPPVYYSGTALLAMQPPVFRPRDAGFWSNAPKELSRLAAAGAVATPLHGYYVVVPAGRVGDRSWRPTIEGFVLALAQRVADADGVALMGVSAARLHGALPRALATAVVAVGEQRRVLQTAWGDVVFVVRDVGALEVQRAETDLTRGWAPSSRRLLDIADRPTLGGIDAREASEVIAALAPRAEWEAVADLSERQCHRAAYARVRWVADPVIDAGAPMPAVPSHRDRYADPLGLRPVGPVPNGALAVRRGHPARPPRRITDGRASRRRLSSHARRRRTRESDHIGQRQ